MLRRMQRHVTEEGMNCGEADVPTAGGVVAFLLKVIEERPEE
jgi:hypothetical protein